MQPQPATALNFHSNFYLFFTVLWCAKLLRNRSCFRCLRYENQSCKFYKTQLFLAIVIAAANLLVVPNCLYIKFSSPSCCVQSRSNCIESSSWRESSTIHRKISQEVLARRIDYDERNFQQNVICYCQRANLTSVTNGPLDFCIYTRKTIVSACTKL